MRYIGVIATLVLAGLLASSPASARRLSVEIRTDKGHEAVYQPGDQLEVRAKPSTDAHLLIYEIDAEGFVHVLFPADPADDGWVQGKKTIRLPERGSDYALVVQDPVGQAYLVAIASRDPFGPLPWYLRSSSVQANEIGYHGQPVDEDEGITQDGRIVGDPFVAMERIRRQVVGGHDEIDAFATAFTSYYVHEQVQYPRYVCYDCHRPQHWNWWAGFDPYYTSCSTIQFRVNWQWSWGPSYWFGYTPYFVYVYRPDCPPGYRYGYNRGYYYSSWDGYGRYRKVWGGSIIRHKAKKPPGYIPPGKKYKRSGKGTPPGYVKGGRDLRTKPVGDIGRGSGKLADGGRAARGRSVARGSKSLEPRQVQKGRSARQGKRLDTGRVKRVDPGSVRKGGSRSGLRTGKAQAGRMPSARRGKASPTVRTRVTQPVRRQEVRRSKSSTPKRIRSTPRPAKTSKSLIKRAPAPKRAVKRSAPKRSSQPKMKKSPRQSSRPARRSKG